MSVQQSTPVSATTPNKVVEIKSNYLLDIILELVAFEGYLPFKELLIIMSYFKLAPSFLPMDIHVTIQGDGQAKKLSEHVGWFVGRRLRVSCRRVTDAGFVHLAKLPLHSLEVSDCDITDAGVAHLSSLPLHSLVLRDCYKVTDDGFAHLLSLSLKKLVISGSCDSITDAGLVGILLKFPLEILELTCCYDITDTVMENLPSTLKELTISDCYNISDAGVASLTCLNLSKLKISACDDVTDAGFAHLSSLPLHSLCVTYCDSITDDGLAHLSSLPLEELNISNCDGITRAGLVEHLYGHKSLTKLVTEYTNSEGEIECKNCSFLFDSAYLPCQFYLIDYCSGCRECDGCSYRSCHCDGAYLYD